jgi:hypothetical protein
VIQFTVEETQFTVEEIQFTVEDIYWWFGRGVAHGQWPRG